MDAALLFSPAADFSGIGTEPLFIAEVILKAFVEVNEEGTARHILSLTSVCCLTSM